MFVSVWLTQSVLESEIVIFVIGAQEADPPEDLLIFDSETNNFVPSDEGPVGMFKVYTYNRGCDIRRSLLHVIKSPYIVSCYKFNFGKRSGWAIYKDFLKEKVDKSDWNLFEGYVPSPNQLSLRYL